MVGGSLAVQNASLTDDTLRVVEALDRLAGRPEVQAEFHRAQADGVAQLQRNPDLVSAAVPLTSLIDKLPVGVSSARVFVSRAPDTNISERHSNCIQYLFPLDVSVETHVMTTAGWRIDRYGGEDVAALQSRWHVVPAGVWHRTVAPGVQNWAIVAFHSAHQVNDELRDLEN
jgi:hypothetical protein